MSKDERSSDWRALEMARRGVLRELNERLASLGRRVVDEDSDASAQFVCECGYLNCTEPVWIPLDAYERLRTEPRRYLIAVNHEDPETETVITLGADHAIVETLAGEASRLAVSTDPRRRARLAELTGERKRPLHLVDRDDAP